MTVQIIENYLKDALAAFRNYKQMAEKSIAQVSDEEFFRALDEADNSIAVIVKHIAGNQRSRWRDFLTSDGEKPDRNRDTEFEVKEETRKSLMEYWETGWRTLFDALESLTPEDFERTVTIRGEEHSVIEAINRQLTHYAYHIGQIVFLAKHFRSKDWQTLSVPKNKSHEFNEFLARKKAAGEEKTHPLSAPQEFAEKHR
jgi:hypothetical protein